MPGNLTTYPQIYPQFLWTCLEAGERHRCTLDGQIGSTEKRPINSDDPRYAGSETVAAGS